jgi:hypothetical protein
MEDAMIKYILALTLITAPAFAQVDDESGTAIDAGGGYQFGTTTNRNGQTTNWQEFGSGNTRFYSDSSGRNCMIIRSGSYSNVNCN